MPCPRPPPRYGSAGRLCTLRSAPRRPSARRWSRGGPVLEHHPLEPVLVVAVVDNVVRLVVSHAVLLLDPPAVVSDRLGRLALGTRA